MGRWRRQLWPAARQVAEPREIGSVRLNVAVLRDEPREIQLRLIGPYIAVDFGGGISASAERVKAGFDGRA